MTIDKKDSKESAVPANNSVRKPTEKKKFVLGDFLGSIGEKNVPDKELVWIRCSEGIEKATGMPGVPKGYVTLARGFSNTGKSTLVCEAIVAAQKMGIFPIIIDTENNLGIDRLKLMGFDWDGNYIMVDNEFLLEHFGKKQNKDRKEAAIEDLGKCLHYFLDLQDAGQLPFDLLFAIDSIGTLNCIKTIDAQESDGAQNNMWNAFAYEKTFMTLLNSTIPSSRKSNKKYTNTVAAVQKIWIDNMNGGGVKHKGGEAFFFGARLIYHFGGIVAHGVKKVTATSKKREVVYGSDVKVNIAKNHIDGPLGGISMEGRIISAPHGFIYPDDIEAYKKKNILYFRNIFGSDIEADDIETKFRNVNANGDIITNGEYFGENDDEDETDKA